MNLDSLEGIVDPSRLGADSRISFSQDPSSLTLNKPWEDVPPPEPQNPPAPAAPIKSQHQGHTDSPVHVYTQTHVHAPAPAPAVGPTDNWFEASPFATNGNAMVLPPPITGSAFTNPFAPAFNSSFATNKRRRSSLTLMLNSPTSRVALPPPLPLPLPPTGMHTTAISPPNGDAPNDPSSPSWVAPESWAVKRQDGDEDATSMSGESEDNLQMQEPALNVAVKSEDDHSQGHEIPTTIGRQGSLLPNVAGEYKIRVINETGDRPYVIYKIPYTETAQSFIKTKFNAQAQPDAEYRLWIQDRGKGANCVYSSKRSWS
jgi:hypothetical protein